MRHIMATVTINDEMKIAIPEGFVEMSREEMKVAYGDDVPDRYAVKNDNEHIIFCVYWHRGPSFLSKLADCKSLRDRCEKIVGKKMRNHQYKLEENFESALCGLEVQGFRHTYVVQDTEMISEVRVLKRENVSYTLYFYTRKETEQTAMPILKDILDSIQF